MKSPGTNPDPTTEETTRAEYFNVKLLKMLNFFLKQKENSASIQSWYQVRFHYLQLGILRPVVLINRSNRLRLQLHQPLKF